MEEIMLEPEPLVNFVAKEVIAENEMTREQEPSATQSSEMEESSSFKLHQQDTESRIRAEIKQLMLVTISEQTKVNVLKEMYGETEQHISKLQNKEEREIVKGKMLDAEVQADKGILEKSQIMINKINEMTVILKQNIVEQEKILQEIKIKNILEKSLQQRQKFQKLKEQYEPTIAEINNRREIAERKHNDKNTLLSLELNQKKDYLNSLNCKQNDLNHLNKFLQEQIDNKANLKRSLEKKLSNMDEKKCYTEFINKQKIILQKLEEEKCALIQRYDELCPIKEQLENEITENKSELDVLNDNLEALREQLEETKIKVVDIEKSAETTKMELNLSSKEIEGHNHEVKEKLKMVTIEQEEVKNSYNILTNEFENLRSEYVKMCSTKLEFVQNDLKHQNEIEKLETKLLQYEAENSLIEEKLISLQHKYDEKLTELKVLETNVETESQKYVASLHEAKAKSEQIQIERERFFDEFNKKKEYSLASTKYLEETLQQEQEKLKKLQEKLKTIQEAEAAKKLLLDSKQQQLDKAKMELELLKASSGAQKKVLKSGLKSPGQEMFSSKKVKFNEVLSVKNMTPESSEISGSQVESEMGKSLLDLLEAFKKPSPATTFFD